MHWAQRRVKELNRKDMVDCTLSLSHRLRKFLYRLERDKLMWNTLNNAFTARRAT